MYLFFSQLMALKSCHERNITHRDVKPGEALYFYVLDDLDVTSEQTDS